jgi:hypothetical protein
MKPVPPILDYRTRRSQSDRVVWYEQPGLHFAVLTLPLVGGWIYVGRELLAYCTTAAQFSGSAVVIALVTLVATITLGFAVRDHRGR